MKQKFYAESIEILSNDMLDYKKMLFQIAKTSPSVVVAAYRTLHNLDGIEGKCRNLVLSGKKIDAIKEYRRTTGASLLDSKNFVETLI